MANYVSTLTGPQMDAALLDMAEHNSEAWAVGTRDGEAVSSADITYHNNAAYYADQANGAAARAEAAVPPSTAGAVFFDRAQTLSEAQQTQVQSNIGAYGVPARNLLDNGWFTINQRQRTSASASGSFIVDRWKIIQNLSATVNDDGSITLQPTASGNTYFVQDFPRGTFAVGEKLTISLLVNGVIHSRNLSFRDSAGFSALQPSLSGVTVCPYQVSNVDRIAIRLTGGTSQTVTLTAVKVEHTQTSTLALDSPPDYATELLKCQRYLHVIRTRSGIAQIGMGIRWSSSGQYRLYIQLPIEMRTTPTVTVDNISNLMGYYQSSTGYSATSLSAPNVSTYDKAMLLVTCAGLPSSAAVATFGLSGGEKMIISAEV